MATASREPRAARLGIGSCLASVALLAGCDPSATADGRSSAAAPITVQAPPALARLRVPDTDALRVVLTLDGTELAVSGEGEGSRGARFAADRLAADGTPSILVARWFYDLGSTSLEIALSEPLEVRRGGERSLVLDRYDTDADRDEDGRSNLDELTSGGDPLVADEGSDLVPSSGPDCRWFFPEGVPRPLVRPTVTELASPTTDSLAIVPNAVGDRAWYGAFTVSSGGSLRIPHLAGLPVDTDALFYRRAPAVDIVNPALPSTILTLSDTRDRAPDAGRGVVPAPPNTTLPVEPSIVYCYVLLAPEPLIDTVIELSLTPRVGSGR